MPRIRTIKPEALQHRKVGKLSDRAFRLWIGMLTQADDHGRLVVDLEQFKLIFFGYHRVSIESIRQAVQEVSRAGLVRTWSSSDGQEYGYFPSWSDHQRVSHPSPSLLPEPPFHKEAVPGEIRVELAKRHGCKPGESLTVSCHYCKTARGAITWFLTSRGKPSAWVHFQDLEMDHVEPELLGGRATADNIVLACRACNRSKGPRTPGQWQQQERSGTFRNVIGGSEGSEGEKGSEGLSAPAGALEGAPPAGWEGDPEAVTPAEAVERVRSLVADVDRREDQARAAREAVPIRDRLRGRR